MNPVTPPPPPPPVQVEPLDPALVQDLSRLFERRIAKDWSEVLRLWRRLEGPLAGCGLDHARFAAMNAAAFSAGEIGLLEVAVDIAHRMVVLVDRLADDPGAPAEAAIALAVALHRVGDSEVAVSLLDTATALPGVGHHTRLRALNTLAGLLLFDAQQTGDLDPPEATRPRLQRARRHAEQAWSLATELQADRWRLSAMVNLGAALLYLGERTAALRLLGSAWSTAGGLPDWPHAHLVAEARLRDGQPVIALDHARAALAARTDAMPRHSAERTLDVAWRAARELGLHEEAVGHLAALERMRRSLGLRRRTAASRLATLRHEALAAFDRLHRERLLADDRERRASLAAPVATDLQEAPAPRTAAAVVDQAARHGPSLVAVVSFAGTRVDGGWTAGHRTRLMHELGRTCRAGDRLLPHRARGFLLVCPGVGAAAPDTMRERLVEAVRRAGAWLAAPDLVDGVDIGLAAAPPADALRRAEQDLRTRRAQRRATAATATATATDAGETDEA